MPWNPNTDIPRARTCDLDPTCRALLPVLRHILTTLDLPASQAWRLAFSSAVHTWGEARGLALAHRTQNFVIALAGSRSAAFDYSDPLDPIERDQLTGDEKGILALLTGLRREQEHIALDALEALTGGRVEASVLRAGVELAQMLDPMGGDDSSGGPEGSSRRPLLRLVS